MKVGSLFLLFVGSAVATKQVRAGNYDDDDYSPPAAAAAPAYHAEAAAAPAYHAEAAAAPVYHAPAPAYHPAPMAQAYAAPVEAEEFHIHPACNSGGPTAGYAAPMAMEAPRYGASEARGGGYRNLRSDRTLFEDDLQEPFDDPGCGHGVCVLAPGGHGECICDASFMTTEDSGPCGQHQKSQGVAFLLQLFLGPFGAGAFYLGGGWIATALICLLFGHFGLILAPIFVCCVAGVFRDISFCTGLNCCRGLFSNPNSVLCCATILHSAALITWFVSLIVIGADCKVHGIPCVPM